MMKKEDKDLFDAGYWECRTYIKVHLEEILAAPQEERTSLLEDLVEELINDECEECWQSAKELEPGLTREKYDAGLVDFSTTLKGMQLDG